MRGKLAVTYYRASLKSQNQLSLRATLWERSNLKILDWDCFIRGLIRNDTLFLEMPYNIMTKGIDFIEEGIALYQQKFKEQRVKHIEKQARYFGYSLSQIEAT